MGLSIGGVTPYFESLFFKPSSQFHCSGKFFVMMNHPADDVECRYCHFFDHSFAFVLALSPLEELKMTRKQTEILMSLCASLSAQHHEHVSLRAVVWQTAGVVVMAPATF
jgi:hypothetical protein